MTAVGVHEPQDILTRRATALAFLDVAGYARLTERDEEGTVRRWSSVRRGVIEPLVDAYRGRVVDRAGDGLLLAFPSADDAIDWAASVQKALGEESQDASLPVRIAVHFGQVLEGTQGDIHGADIHTAQRLQCYAEPGSIVVSRAAADQARSPLPGRVTDLGPLHLRHIAEPVRALSVRLARPQALDIAAVASEAGRRSGRRDPGPSVAVLPFRDTAAPEGDDYFAGGMIEGILHVLSGLDGLTVISRGSTHAYGPEASPLDVGEALGVQYVLGGSLRRSGDRLRITVELSDARTGELIRTDRHDGQASDLFTLQDRISLQVATTLAPELREREIRRAMRRHPDSLDAYDLVLQALAHLQRLEPASFATARALLGQAQLEDPTYGTAFAYMAWWHILRIAMGWSPDIAEDAEEGRRAAVSAIQRNGNDALALAVSGYAIGYTLRDFETAGGLLERAIAVGPNCAPAWGFSGVNHGWMEDGPQAVAHCLRGVRLAPYDPIGFLYYHYLSQSYYVNGDYERAVAWGRRSAALNPRHTPNLRTILVSLVALGRMQEASETAERIRETEPEFTLERFIARTPLRGRLLESFVSRFRAAGF
ncbi:adenylate/guanylate cyclase domain-containing protein [Elioraea rosea]|uniref:adenylate/guanylate cyclase domain-containing protein n=1 Tax=Elioraea rosea TaxID=2492390 RepID=UPI0011829B40|nr:adenylate/guanylate cyclase domain-containing protein [Elioraea rosea]